MPSITNQHEPFPFFVYGTLRPGWHNAANWMGVAEARHDGDCYVGGFRLVTHSATYAGFPYALPAENETTTGCLIHPHDGEYETVRRSLDALEGYPHHYDRWCVAVDTPEGAVLAWMYVPTHPERYEHNPTVPGNDWENMAAAR